MIRAEAITFNAFQVNSYLVWDDSGDCLLVDPAFYSREEQEYFESLLSERKLKLRGQINTHCHVDHLLGVAYIRNKHGFPFRANQLEEKIAANASLTGELFGWEVEDPGGIKEGLEDGQLVEFGNSALYCIHVPGHSPGSIAFHAPKGNFVITGDALFQGSIGRTDLPGGDYDTLMESIKERLLVLPPETTVLPGHGPASTIGIEIVENPFLRELL